MDSIVAAALFLIAQAGMLVWTVSAIRADLKNITGWLHQIDIRAESAHDLAIKTTAKLCNLPCQLKGQCEN